MSMKWFILLALILAGCGTSPTRYHKEKKNEGYSDSSRENLSIVTFKANHYTKEKKARLYAEFHAIENCIKRGYKFANVLDIFNKSISKEITRTNSNNLGPSYYGGYGMYPFYSRYSSFGIGLNYTNVSSSSWNETQTYPRIEIPYTCVNTIYRPLVIFREVPPEEMKILVKDLKGGIQVQKFLDGSPNAKTLAEGDIILRANGNRIERVYEMMKLFDEKSQKLDLDLLRDGVKMKLPLLAQDVSKVAGEAEDKVIKDACKDDDIHKKYKKTFCK